MRNKVSVAFLCVILIFAFLSTSVFARDDYKERTTYKLNRGPKYMIPFERANGAQVLDHKDDVSLALLGKMPTTSPGVQAGLTTYDYQHNGTMGRQIETFPGVSYVHFVWMAMSTYTFPGDRGIKYQCYNADPAVMDYTQDAGGKWGTTDYSGYTSAAALPDGRAIFGCHADYDGNDIYLSMAYTDAPGFPGWALFTGEVARPDTGASWYVTDEEIIWPIMARHNAGGNTTSDVLYMLSHVNEANEDLILYRKVGTADFDGGQKIETITDLSYTIVADPYSNNVYIVYTDDRIGMDEGDGGQDNLDVWYKKSTDQGATWGSSIDVSNYTGDSLWRAYDDLSAVISPDGNLHIIWPARQLNDSNTYENAKCRLVHWSTDIPQARILSEARYTMEERCDPGAWNMYIAKPSISWCDDRLYALWTQFGHARETGAKGDCSQAGFANGELYLAVSNDNGFTWDLPANLTQSRTPRCDSAECDSDHWSSMTSYGMVYDGVADTLDIQYVNDKDAGGLPQGEGSWCVNPIMHLRIPCRDIIPTPQVSLVPNQFLDPTQTAPGVQKDTNLTVINIGNATLTGTFSIDYVTEGGDWLTVSPASVSIPSGTGNTADFTIGLNAGGIITTQPTGWDAYILLTSNAPTSPDTISVHLTVGNINMPEFAILNTTCKMLKAWNTGRSGDHDGPYSMVIPGDCDTTTTAPDMRYLYDGSPMLSWLKSGTTKTGYTSVFEQQFTEQQTWRPQTDLTLTNFTGYDKLTYTVSSADSIFGCDVEIWIPTNGANCFFVQNLKYYLWGTAPAAQNDIYVGYFMDWDTPSDSTVDNGSGYLATPYPTVWQSGKEWQADNLPCDINEDNRRGGLALFKTTIAGGSILYGAWTKINADNQSGSGFDAGFLYDNMSAAGVNLYAPATGERPYIDLHTGVTFDKLNMVAGTKYEYVFALVTTNLGEADYNSQVAAAKLWYDGLQTCCNKAGDANNDNKVNVGDAVYIISYVFRGGPAPICSAEGNANGDLTPQGANKINVGDAVYIISYVFRGGPAPVCGVGL